MIAAANNARVQRSADSSERRLARMMGKAAAVMGMLAFGTATSLMAKVVFQLRAEGDAHGGKHAFAKPYFMTLVMFVGMTLCIPVYALTAGRRRRADGATEGKPSIAKQCMLLAIPSAFDLIATALMNVGLLSVTASVYQMMRSAELVFAAVFGVFFLQRRLVLDHYMGIASAIAGVALVGAANLLADPSTDSEGGSKHDNVSACATGMVLILASQAVQAAQLTFEDSFLHDFDVDVSLLVGMEGVWGSVLTAAILVVAQYVPGNDNGVVEDSADTFAMLRSSTLLLGVVLAQGFALFLYNIFGVSVTGNYNAVFRTVLETLRTLFVWVADLVLFYGHTGLGERWTSYSPMQALGFVFLVLATLIYASGDAQVTKQEAEANVADDSVRTPLLAPGGEDDGASPTAVQASGGSVQSDNSRLSSSPAVVIGNRLRDLMSHDLPYSTSLGKSTHTMSHFSPGIAASYGTSPHGGGMRPRLEATGSSSSYVRAQRGGSSGFTFPRPDASSPGADDGSP